MTEKIHPNLEKHLSRFEEIVSKYWDCNVGDYPSEWVNMMLSQQYGRNYLPPNDGAADIPQLSVACGCDDSGNMERFIVWFELSNTPYSSYCRDSQLSEWMASEQQDSFTVYDIGSETHYRVSGEFRMDFHSLGVLLTEIYTTLGVTKSLNTKAEFTFNYTKGDISLAKFPDGLAASRAVYNALKTCVSLATNYDLGDAMCLYLTIGADDKGESGILLFVDNECVSIECRKEDPVFDGIMEWKDWHNCQCLHLTHYSGQIYHSTILSINKLGLEFIATFLTDIILHKQPYLTSNDITALLDLNADPDIDDPDRCFLFTASQSPDEANLIKALQEYIQFYNEDITCL